MKKSKNTLYKKKTERKQNKKQNLNKTNKKYLIVIFSGLLQFSLNFFIMFPERVELQSYNISSIPLNIFNLLCSLLISYSIYNLNLENIKKIIKIVFLIFILISVYPVQIHLNSVLSYNSELYIKLYTWQKIIVLPAIFVGAISLFQHKNRLEKFLENIYNKNTGADKNTNKRIGKIPLNYLILVAIAGLSIFTLFYRLDYFDLFSDEAQVTQGAAGYYYTGEYKLWDFVQDKPSEASYERAWPHQFLVALSYRIWGISTWSSRLPSAIFGVLLILLGFIVGKKFIKEETAVLLTLFSFVFYVEFLFLQRWTRMYSILLVTFLIEFYLFYKFITGKNSIAFKRLGDTTFFQNYLNFDYKYLPFLLLFIYLNFQIHINSVIIFPIFYIFSIYLLLANKDKRQIVVIFVGGILILLRFIFPYLVSFTLFSFFEVRNQSYYLNAFLGYPFSIFANLIIISIIITSFLYNINKDFKATYFLLIISTIVGFVLFGFILSRYSAFKYMSFLAPLSMMLLVGSYYLILKVLYNRLGLALLGLFMVFSIGTHFYSIYDDIYVENFASPAKPSVAWNDIIKNYKEGEVIGRHWGPSLYFSGISKDARFFSIDPRTGITFTNIYDTLRNNSSGWLTWHTHFSGKIEKKVIDYANLYMQKRSGFGIDKTGVEVFYYTKDLLKDTLEFEIDRNFPHANLNLHNSFSFAFWLNINENTSGNPFHFTNSKEDKLSINVNKNIVIAYNKKRILSAPLTSGWHHVVFIHDYNESEKQGSLYIDGNFISKNEVSEINESLVKFNVNKVFNGITDDIRIYDFILNNKLIQNLAKSPIGTEKKIVLNNKEFSPMFFWQRRQNN